MLNVLLIKLEAHRYISDDFVGVVADNEYDVLFTEKRVPLLVNQEYYTGSEEFNKKEDEINKLLGIEHSGYVVAIDKYTIDSYPKGAKKTDWSGISRYMTDFSVDVLSYDLIILLCPDFERIVLSKLDFAYKGNAYISGVDGLLIFDNRSVLSLKTFWGAFRGIALQEYNKLAVDPNKPNECYALRFEERQIPEVVLNKLCSQQMEVGG